jgi:hypothetical protein
MKEKENTLAIIKRQISRGQFAIKFHILVYMVHKVIFQIYGI